MCKQHQSNLVKALPDPKVNMKDFTSCSLGYWPIYLTDMPLEGVRSQQEWWMLVVQFANAIITEGTCQPLLVMLGCPASLLPRLLALLKDRIP